MNYPEPEVLSAGALIGEPVESPEGERLGIIEELMIDMERRNVAYAVLAPASVHARESRLRAVPWGALRRSEGRAAFVLEADLLAAPAFERGQWPHMSDQAWGEQIHNYYDQVPYWQKSYFGGQSSGPTQMGGHKKPSPFHK